MGIVDKIVHSIETNLAGDTFMLTLFTIDGVKIMGHAIFLSKMRSGEKRLAIGDFFPMISGDLDWGKGGF